jgi:hypothetical protein
VHDAGKFVATAMKAAYRTFRVCGALVLLSAGVWAQDSSPSLSDVARKARKERSSEIHTPAKRLTDDQDEPDAGGVWRTRLCSNLVCYTLSVSLPKSPRWIRPSGEPRPVLIPVAGHEDDLTHAVRIYKAEQIPTNNGTADAAKRAFLQAWFSRAEYFGQPARISNDERLPSETGEAKLSHFTVNRDTTKFRGVSVVEGSPLGFYGFACVFQDEDAGTASSVCDAIIRSAHAQTFLTAYKRPAVDPPTYYPNDDPSDDPRYDPPDEDPE